MDLGLAFSVAVGGKTDTAEPQSIIISFSVQESFVMLIGRVRHDAYH